MSFRSPGGRGCSRPPGWVATVWAGPAAPAFGMVGRLGRAGGVISGGFSYRDSLKSTSRMDDRESSALLLASDPKSVPGSPGPIGAANGIDSSGGYVPAGTGTATACWNAALERGGSRAGSGIAPPASDGG